MKVVSSSTQWVRIEFEISLGPGALYGLSFLMALLTLSSVILLNLKAGSGYWKFQGQLVGCRKKLHGRACFFPHCPIPWLRGHFRLSSWGLVSLSWPYQKLGLRWIYGHPKWFYHQYFWFSHCSGCILFCGVVWWAHSLPPCILHELSVLDITHSALLFDWSFLPFSLPFQVLSPTIIWHRGTVSFSGQPFQWLFW